MPHLEFQRGAEPFFLKGNRVGCLLTHGLTGSPYSQRWLGDYLHERDFTVLAPRLSGHGTTPRNLAGVAWQNWYYDVLSAYRTLRAHCDIVVCAGLSMGAVVTMLLAAKEQPDAIILMSAVYQIEGSVRRTGVQAVGWVGGMWPKDLDHEDSARLRAEVRMEQQKRYGETYQTPGYDVWPLRAVYQLERLLKHTHKLVPAITVPIQFIHARHDPTAPYQYMQHYYNLVGSAEKDICTLEAGGHVITQDLDRQRVFEAVAAFVQKQAEKHL